MTCRCVMCGAKNAGTLGRGSYAHANVMTSENKSVSEDKRKGRKLRRVREKRQLNNQETD